MPEYKAPLRDMRFLIDEVFDFHGRPTGANPSKLLRRAGAYNHAADAECNAITPRSKGQDAADRRHEKARRRAGSFSPGERAASGPFHQ